MFHAYNYLTYLLLMNQAAFEKFKWIGNITTYVAGLAVGVSLSAATEAWPFALYIVGNLVWFIAAVIMRDRPLFWLNLFFIAANAYAILIRL
jgi:hypothetical protein